MAKAEPGEEKPQGAGAVDAKSADQDAAGTVDAADADATGPSDAQATLDVMRVELDLAKDRLARARADYDNLQKRTSRDAALERDRAKARVLEGLLPLYELCQMAANQAKAHPSLAEAHGVVEGVVLLAREFRRTLEREGLVPVGAVGEPFDATLHEAVAEDAVEGVEPGCVSRIVQPGYRLGDKVLRFAKVAVQPPAR